MPPLPEAALREALRHQLLNFLCSEGVLDAALAERILEWRHSGFSVHIRVRSKDNAGRHRLARYMTRCPFALEKMRYDKKSGTVIYRSRLHTNLQRNYQLMPALKWLRMLMNHIPCKYEHLVRYHGYYSNRARGARRLVENSNEPAGPIRIDEPPADSRRKANWARLIQKVYEMDLLKCANCGGSMRIIAAINDAGVIERHGLPTLSASVAGCSGRFPCLETCKRNRSSYASNYTNIGLALRAPRLELPSAWFVPSTRFSSLRRRNLGW